jgi:hypothetical protein
MKDIAQLVQQIAVGFIPTASTQTSVRVPGQIADRLHIRFAALRISALRCVRRMSL